MQKLGLLLFSLFLASCSSYSGENSDLDNSNTSDLALFTTLETITPNGRSLSGTETDWYKDAIFYHVWVPSFFDGPDVGTIEGDLKGLIEKLPYLKDELGVTALWLSPIFNSASGSSNRHNYDVTDHFTVHPALGTNQDLYDLIQAVHTRGMRIIWDHVPNHVSNQHPWFSESKNASSSKNKWFIWTSQKPSGFTGFDSFSDFRGPLNGLYFYALFWDGMPDLNYRNSQVRDAMGNIIIHWLNAGFDGLRVDAVKYLYEDWSSPTTGYREHPLTYSHFRQIRTQILDNYSEATLAGGPYPKFMVAENWDSNRTNLLSYMSKDGSPIFQMTLDFPFAYAAAGLNWADLRSHWEWVNSTVIPAGGWMGSFLSNHDNVVSRPVTQHGGDSGRVRVATALNLLGLGTPFIYYGNEIGMTGAAGNDINLRTKFNWSTKITQETTPNSLLKWHQALIQLRKNQGALRRGNYTNLITSKDSEILAFERDFENDKLVVVISNSSQSQSGVTITLPSAATQANTLWGTTGTTVSDLTLSLNSMVPYGVRVIKLGEAEDGSTAFEDIQ